MLIDLSHQEGRPAKTPKRTDFLGNGWKIRRTKNRRTTRMGWEKNPSRERSHIYRYLIYIYINIYIYPTKREVRKISIFKSAFLEGICDHSLEGTTTVRK